MPNAISYTKVVPAPNTGSRVSVPPAGAKSSGADRVQTVGSADLPPLPPMAMLLPALRCCVTFGTSLCSCFWIATPLLCFLREALLWPAAPPSPSPPHKSGQRGQC